MTTTSTELNAAAMKNLGIPYLECSDEQREAVESGVAIEKLIALMHERGAETIGDLSSLSDLSSALASQGPGLSA